MHKHLLIAAGSLLLMNCNTHVRRDSGIKDTIAMKQEMRRIDSLAYDSTRRVYLKRLDEPDIISVNVETYRFAWITSGMLYLFRIQTDTKGNTTLISKYILEDQAWKRSYGKTEGLFEDTVLQVTSQIVSKNDWRTFKEILDGSYYWALDRAPFDPNQYGALHNNNQCNLIMLDRLGLESYSSILNIRPMTYHNVQVIITSKGSLVRACGALMELSDLTKKDAKKLLAGLE